MTNDVTTLDDEAAAEKAAKIERKAILDTAAEQIDALRYPASKYLSFTQRQAWSIRDDALSDAMAVVARLREGAVSDGE